MIQRFHPSTFLVSFAASIALAVAACGGSDGPPSKLSQAYEESIHRSCDKAFMCKSSYLPAMHMGRSFEDFVGGTNSDACFNTGKTFTLATFGQDFFTKLDASVKAGRIKYNANDYEACTQSFEMSSCDQVLRQNNMVPQLGAACATAAAGQVATGAACTLDGDCATVGDGCDPSSNTCAPAQRSGEVTGAWDVLSRALLGGVTIP